MREPGLCFSFPYLLYLIFHTPKRWRITTKDAILLINSLEDDQITTGQQMFKGVDGQNFTVSVGLERACRRRKLWNVGEMLSVMSIFIEIKRYSIYNSTYFYPGQKTEVEWLAQEETCKFRPTVVSSSLLTGVALK
jgi:hypothetical protein